jgi:hypothetical protein
MFLVCAKNNARKKLNKKKESKKPKKNIIEQTHTQKKK